MRLAAPRWSSEAAMLDVIQEAARARGWRCCPESAGHDLVLVVGDNCGDGDLQVGDQIVIEGKLRACWEVLSQALPPNLRRRDGARGADWYAVAIPGSRRSRGGDFSTLAAALGIVIVQVATDRHPLDPDVLDPLLRASPRMRCCGQPPLVLPGIDVQMQAGRPAPRSLSPWKIAAVRLCLLGQQRELTTEDFRGTPVRHRTFLDRGWMEPVRRTGRVSTYRLLDPPGRPDAVYPEIVAAIEAAPDFGSGAMSGSTEKE